MQVKIQVAGTRNFVAKKSGRACLVAFGFEAAPCTLRKPLNVWCDASKAAPVPGSVITVDVQDIDSSKGDIFVSGSLVNGSHPAAK